MNYETGKPLNLLHKDLREAVSKAQRLRQLYDAAIANGSLDDPSRAKTINREITVADSAICALSRQILAQLVNTEGYELYVSLRPIRQVIQP